MSPTALPAAGPEHGHVTFLGAGPGDPGLLTLRAVEALSTADVLVAEHEVLDVIRTHARPGVSVVPTDADSSAVSPPGTGTPQLTVVDGTSTPVAVPAAARDAAHLVMEAARGGRRVVRAVSGDPGLDTYAAEEMLACAAAGVPFEVVPGVAAAVGVPAYAGVPLRDAEGADVRFVDARTASDRCWTEVGASDGTVVVSTTLDSVAAAAGELVSAGRKPDTPLTVTIAGTTTRQRTWTATLGTIAQTLKQAKVLPSPDGGRPVIAGVGERSAADRRDQLSWFESKPLFGWKVLVPRTKEQAASLSDQLRSYGAVPHEVPTIAVEPPRTPQQMERAVKGLVTGRYEWIAFTSVNAVKAVREKFEEYGLDARAFAGIKVAAVGEQTAKALIAFGVKPDLVPSGEHSAAGQRG
ncbi:SAM-dependent methyltransferase, partial [Streptomyces tricolor]